MSEQLEGYGSFVSDSDESLITKAGAKFGGNFGDGTLIKFAYNPNVSKEGEEPREAVEITVKIGDREYKDWINPITKVVDKNNVEITDRQSAEYITKFNDAIRQQKAVFLHYLKAVGVSEDAVKAATATPPTSFADYAQRLCSLLPIGFDKKPLDIFLEYQWNYGKKQDGSFQDKTYPTLPRNMKGGYFIVPAQPGVWVESREGGSLCYTNSNGAKHPFERSKDFMESNKGKQQTLATATTSGPGSPMSSSSTPAPTGNAGGGWQ
jgi:hypothetical protein